jgi:hypothetical protein
MNYIRHLSGFFNRVEKEDSLNPTHISLYMSLFQAWNINRFVNPISISRSEMMGVSKICSKATYHKVMKDLDKMGFIKYEPSYNPFRGSAVHLVNLESEEVQKVNRRHTKKQTSGELAVNSYRTKKQEGTVLLNEPYINNTNIINSKHCKQQVHDDTSSDFDNTKNAEEKKPVSQSFREDRKSSTPGPAVLPLPQSLEKIKEFFLQQKATANEAEKFYNYFQSNGWKVGGRAPMKDWQAAARNWMLNINKFNPEKIKQGSLHVSTTKDYSEPL